MKKNSIVFNCHFSILNKVAFPNVRKIIFSPLLLLWASVAFCQRAANEKGNEKVRILTKNAETTAIVSGPYLLEYNSHHNYIRIQLQQGATTTAFLALRPGGGAKDFDLLHSRQIQKISCLQNSKVVSLEIASRVNGDDYIFKLQCPRSQPGLINSRIYLRNKLSGLQYADRFEGQYPELQYMDPKEGASSGVMNRLIYYFNGTPGSFTYHTVADDSSGIYDLNQFIYFGDPGVLESTVQYYEDFTSLNPFFIASGTKIENTVKQPQNCLKSPVKDLSGNMATFGFDIPATTKIASPDSFMLVSNSWIQFTPGVPAINQSADYCDRFIRGVASIFPHLNKPESKFIDWPWVVEKGIGDLISSGKQTGREAIFPQANLNSIRAFVEEFGSANARVFDGQWDKDWTKFNFNLPYGDAWQYLYPLIQAGEYQQQFPSVIARKVFLEAADKVVLLGNRLKYRFPLRINADFSRPDSIRYEYDCTGAYVYLMLLYYHETGQDRFLSEATAAGKELLKMGFEFPFEFTTTGLGPLAMLRLYKLTNDAAFLKGVSIPLAAIVRHSWLFNPDYGVYRGRTLFMLTEAMPGVYANGWEEASMLHYLKKLLVEGRGILPPSSWDMTAELLKWKGVSAADALAPLLPDTSIIYSGIPREWVMKVNKSWYIPMEGFGYLEWDHSGQHDKPGRVSQSPYCFGMLPEAAMMQFHNLQGKSQLYVETPVTFSRINNNLYAVELLAPDGIYHARIKRQGEKINSIKVKEVASSGKAKRIQLTWSGDSPWADFPARTGVKYLIEIK